MTAFERRMWRWASNVRSRLASRRGNLEPAFPAPLCEAWQPERDASAHCSARGVSCGRDDSNEAPAAHQNPGHR